MSTSEHVYEIVVNSSPENVWKALTDGELTQQYYFGTRVESDWAPNSAVRYYDYEGALSSEGKILEIDRGSHIKTTFQPNWIPSDGGDPSKVSWDVEELAPLTLVRLTHTDIDDATFEAAQMHVGWVYILSSMKSLLETKEALPMPEVFA